MRVRDSKIDTFLKDFLYIFEDTNFKIMKSHETPIRVNNHVLLDLKRIFKKGYFFGKTTNGLYNFCFSLKSKMYMSGTLEQFTELLRRILFKRLNFDYIKNKRAFELEDFELRYLEKIAEYENNNVKLYDIDGILEDEYVLVDGFKTESGVKFLLSTGFERVIT